MRQTKGNLILFFGIFVIAFCARETSSSAKGIHEEPEPEPDPETGRYQRIKGAYGPADLPPRLGPCQITEVLQGINGSKSVEAGIWCNDVDNLSIALEQIPAERVLQMYSVKVTNSYIPTLNLSLFRNLFPFLSQLTVSGCNVSFIVGEIPPSLTYLNLSHNSLRSLQGPTFSGSRSRFKPFPAKFLKAKSENPYLTASNEGLNLDDDDDEDEEELTINIEGKSGSDLQVIDLSHNKFTELPKSILDLDELKILRLSGNQLKCEFVWEKLWGWWKEGGAEKVPDADQTYCGVVDDVRVFKYTVLDILKARKELEEICAGVDPRICRDCSLYALQKEDHSISHKKPTKNGGEASSVLRISVSVKLDCSASNLTKLPPVPSQTWQLNISHNAIQDLSPLKEPEYSALRMLDGNHNRVNLETLVGTPFIDKYNYLSLQNNGFTNIPSAVLTSLKTIRGQGITFFGSNYIHCDCQLVKEIKPLLIENSRRIRDMKDIFCRNLPEAGDPSGLVRVKDLQAGGVCRLKDEEEDWQSDLYVYLLILAEAGLIFLVILKVWHDQRTFRRTGILPWCSAKMPRLPCDAMLESVKEGPNFHRTAGSAASSNTNVNTNSVNQFPMRELRGGSGSCGGGSFCSGSDNKSRTDETPHASAAINVPSTSSRTFSV